jgi:hypothetical protein
VLRLAFLNLAAHMKANVCDQPVWSFADSQAKSTRGRYFNEVTAWAI